MSTTPITDSIPRNGPFHNYRVEDVLETCRQLELQNEKMKKASMIEPTDKELCKLDAWIAEHVMELRRVTSPAQIVSGTFFWNKGDVLVHHRQNEIKSFKPTTTPADAMLVLEKCADKGKPAAICIEKLRYKWEVYSEFFTNGAAEGGTLPLAICLFAKQLFSIGTTEFST